MGEAIPAINATGSAVEVTPQETHETKAEKAVKAKPKFDSKLDEVLWSVNAPEVNDIPETKSIDKIVTEAQANAALPSRDANPVLEQGNEKGAKAAQTKKYKVNGKEIELTEEQAERFTQKGILFEKQNHEFTKQKRELAAKEESLTQKEQEIVQTLQAIKEQGLEVLIDLHGEEAARKMIEGWLRPKVEREMMPEPDRRVLDAEERAGRFEAALKERDERDRQTQIEAKAREFEGHYQKVIIDALEKGGFPDADRTIFAADMAAWMQRGLNKGIEYTAEELIPLVKEDQRLRTLAWTGYLVGKIKTAKESKDDNAVIRFGGELAEELGEEVVHALGQYHLAKYRAQGQQPKQILDTPKVKTETERKQKPYMSEDEYKRERLRRVAAMERGESVSETW